MKKIVLTFGLISGGILAAMTVIPLPFILNGTVSFDNGEILGYTTMVLSFLLVFFGIRSYREKNGGGGITFGRAFTVGILITLISCCIYVFTWEIVFFNFIPDFADKYAARTLEKMRKGGATEAALEKTTKEMATFKKLYANPFINAGITFLEPLPVGLAMTLLSAAVLRKRLPPGAPAGSVALA
jgi:hypothetical protein